jgi:hypothetical protein
LVGDKNSELEEAKHVPILPDHLKLLKKEMRKHPAHPNLHFFRHLKGMGGNPPNSPFGKGYLYNKWIKACNELGIENVDLYGGTRHSSQVALRKKGHDTKDIKRAAMTTTDEAHMRYCQINDEELRRLYADANPDNELITFSVSSKKHN